MSSKAKKHVCKKCKMEFSANSHLQRHINRKIPCNKKAEYKCKKCKTIFDREDHYKRHLNRKTSCVPELKNTATTVDNEENKCKYCGNDFATKYSLKRHYGACSVKKNPTVMEQKFIDIIEKQQKSHEKEMAALKELIKNQQPVVNNVTNVTNNTLNDNRQLNITLVNFGQEDLSHITPEIIAGLFDKLDCSSVIPTIIKKIHNDPDHPENHNIYMVTNQEQVVIYGPLPEDPSTIDWYPNPLDTTCQQLTEKAKSLMSMPNGIPKPEFSAIITDEGYTKYPSIMAQNGDTVQEYQLLVKTLPQKNQITV